MCHAAQGIAEADERWTEELEPAEECAQRGYDALRWISQRPESEAHAPPFCSTCLSSCDIHAQESPMLE